jgi:predicted Zn-dependent protease
LAAAEGNLDRAAAELEERLRLQPDDPVVLRALAEVREKSGRGREALELLDRAESLHGEGVETRVRALVLLGERAEARRVLEESPFLGASDRMALEPLLRQEQ